MARPWQEHIAFAAMRAIKASLRANPDYPGGSAKTSLR
jgi:hypothetical protein